MWIVWRCWRGRNPGQTASTGLRSPLPPQLSTTAATCDHRTLPCALPAPGRETHHHHHWAALTFLPSYHRLGCICIAISSGSVLCAGASGTISSQAALMCQYSKTLMSSIITVYGGGLVPVPVPSPGPALSLSSPAPCMAAPGLGWHGYQPGAVLRILHQCTRHIFGHIMLANCLLTAC